MLTLDELINFLYDLLVGKIPPENDTLIKTHMRCLEQLGDISFPIALKNWYRLIDKSSDLNDHIFQYKLNESNIQLGLDRITEKLNCSVFKMKKYTIIKTNVHLFFERPALFSYGINKVFCDIDLYGKFCLFENPVELISCSDHITDVKDADLTNLRLLITKNVANNLLKFTNPETEPGHKKSHLVILSIHVKDDSTPNILCGPVINEDGVKDTKNLASDLLNKRTSDMRMIAQHRYRVNVKSNSEWNKYFLALGTGSVTIEMLSNKPHKPVKITLNDLSGANRGPSFIFYNCARLSVLLKEFDNKVSKNIYPQLPELNNIDYTLLNQQEEWDLLYVYILQFPLVIRNCIRNIDKGIFNPQHLITFLSNLSSVFSVYYRRVRILIEPRDHLFGTIHARIYLLKALQCVFHNALRILNIEPIQEM